MDTTNTTATPADDLRLLIFCDTEFGWRATTTLKLPEIERLFARGWLTEGDGFEGYDVTAAGRAAIALALNTAGHVAGVSNMIPAAKADPVQAAPVEMSPEFTDTARAAIAWVLYHHQGGSSPIGQPLRMALGMGQHESLPDWRIAEAKRYAAMAGAETADFQRGRAPQHAIPERLQSIGHLIATQDNRITESPIFIVQHKVAAVADEDYNAERIDWVHDDGEHTAADPSDAAALEAEYQASYVVRTGWRRVPMRDDWHFVTACFTEQGCKDYLAKNGHNLREPRIYAEGSYRNDEWKAVRDYLLSLAALPQNSGGDEPLFYIQDTRQYVGNCPMWWGKDGRGYVTRLDEAGRYTAEQAINHNRTRDTDVAWPCDEIDRLGRITVDVQHMRTLKERRAEVESQIREAAAHG